MAMQIVPLSGALGSEVTGVDWTRPVDDATIAAIRGALLRTHLVCLRTQPLEPRAFARLARYFGEPQLQLLRNMRIDDVPEVSLFDSTYEKAEDKPADLRLDRRSGWHTDDSYFAKPAKVTLLQALEIPDVGGETGFCNARAAYEDLPEEMKPKLHGMRAVHGYDTLRASARAVQRSAQEVAETPDVVHPLIRTHDETGQRAIYFNSNRTDRIVGLEREESDALLDRIHAHMTQARYQYRHAWRVGDVLMWDNRSVIHSVNMDFPPGQRRVHQRVLLKGSTPV